VFQDKSEKVTKTLDKMAKNQTTSGAEGRQIETIEAYSEWMTDDESSSDKTNWIKWDVQHWGFQSLF
jgi:hypothetical protein